MYKYSTLRQVQPLTHLSLHMNPWNAVPVNVIHVLFFNPWSSRSGFPSQKLASSIKVFSSPSLITSANISYAWQPQLGRHLENYVSVLEPVVPSFLQIIWLHPGMLMHHVNPFHARCLTGPLAYHHISLLPQWGSSALYMEAGQQN